MALGIGFVSRLSGRENIMLSGMLLGFSEKAIREKMDEIIEFSELGEFIDRPVATYSSGMHSKLALASPQYDGADRFSQYGDASVIV